MNGIDGVLRARLAVTTHTENTSMHKIDCPVHGRTFAAYFLMPEPHSYAESGYVCAHCVNAIESAPHGGAL